MAEKAELETNPDEPETRPQVEKARPTGKTVLLRWWWLLPLLLSSGFLALANLDEVAQWCDEAHVTIMARNFLSEGKMTGWNGRNLYGFNNGGALDAQLRPVNAPLDIWVTAAAFRLLGQSDWSARLPFALAGLVSIAFFAKLVWFETGGARLLTFFATASLGLSAAYLLYIRQARYYAFSVLAAVMLLYGYRRYLADHRPRHLVLLALGAIVQFYANPMLCAVLLVALGLTHLIFHLGDWSRREWLGFGAAAWAFLITTLPYAIYFRAWERPDHNYENDPWLLNHAKLIWWNFRDVSWTSTLPLVIIPAVLWVLLRPGRGGERVGHLARQWAVLALLYLLLLSLVSPQVSLYPRTADVRYHSAILPTLAALAGAGLWRVAQVSRAAAALLLLAGLCFTPVTFGPGPARFQWLLPALAREVTAPYPTAANAVVDFLRQNARPGETICSFPEYMNYPVDFHLGERVQLAGMLKPTTHLPRETLEELPEHIWRDKAKPDWLILYGMTEFTAGEAKRYLSPGAEDNVSSAGARLYEPFAFLPVYWREVQRPELPDHSFGPPPNPDWKFEGVYIYRRVGDKPQI